MEYFPAAHVEQLPAPTPEYEPQLQVEHVHAFVPEYCPAGHCVHTLLPVGVPYLPVVQ